MINRVQWNPDYETWDAIYSDGYIEPLRDSMEANKFMRRVLDGRTWEEMPV